MSPQDCMAQVLDDPLRFVEFFWPEINLYDKQAEILRSVRDNKHTFVHAGTGLGKDFITSLAVLWFFWSRSPCKIIISSASEDHLRTVLWAEIQSRMQQTRFPASFPCKVDDLRVRRYSDPGSKVFDPQSWIEGRVTNRVEVFQGAHLDHDKPRVMAVFDEACHDDQTEVLTDRGWMFFCDLSGQERLLTRDPITERCEYHKPIALHRSRRRGIMYRYQRRGCNFCVTPNHRMIHRMSQPGKPGGYSEWREAEIQDIPWRNWHIPRRVVWEGVEPTEFAIPNDGHRHARELRMPIEPFLQFLGWYFSEGSSAWNRGHVTYVTITQKSDEVRREIADIIRAIGFRPRDCITATTPQVHVGGPACSQLARWLVQFGRKSIEKRLPDFLRTLSPRLIEIFLQAFMRGDGYDKPGTRGVFYTSSPAMADGLHELCVLAGTNAGIYKRALVGAKAPNGYARHDGYVIQRSPVDSQIKIRREHLEPIRYDGMVYCATVPPHHSMLTRRGSCVMWSGNSGIADGFFEAADSWAHRILVIGNPLNAVNFFFRHCDQGDAADPSGENALLRKVIHIGAEHSPNVRWGLEWRALGVEHPPPMPPEARIPGVVSFAEYLQREQTWDEFNKLTRHRGRFPKGEEAMLYPARWLELSAQAAVAAGKGRRGQALGVDGGEGRANTAWTVVDHLGVVYHEAYRTPDTSKIASRTLALMREWGVPANRVVFDRGGGGKFISDYLRSQGHDVQTVSFGEAATPQPGERMVRTEAKKEARDRKAYRNRRAEMYGMLRELLNPSLHQTVFGIPAEYEELLQELRPLPLLYNEEGIMFLPPKDRPPGKRDRSSNVVTIVDILGHSPDRADSLVLAVFALKSKAKLKLRSFA